jgi:glutamate formiminotransferase
MKQIIKKVKDLVLNFSETQRKERVEEIADTIIDTLTLSKTDGRGLSATELSSVVLKINSSVFSFLAEKKIRTEETLEDINNALEEIKNGL